MKPSDLSRELRRIASAIDKSKNPSKDLVLKDIKATISKLAMDEYEQHGNRTFQSKLDISFMEGPGETWQQVYTDMGFMPEIDQYHDRKFYITYDQTGRDATRITLDSPSGPVFYDSKSGAGFFNNPVKNHVYNLMVNIGSDGVEQFLV